MGTHQNRLLRSSIATALLSAVASSQTVDRVAPRADAAATRYRLSHHSDLPQKGWRVAWRAGGKILGLARFNGRLQLFSRSLTELAKVGKGVMHFEFGPKDKTYAYNGDRKVILARHGDERKIELPAETNQPGVRYSPDGRYVVTTEYGTRVRMWRVADGEEVRAFELTGTKGGLHASFQPDGKRIAIGNRNGETHVFEVATGRRVFVLSQRSTHDIAYSPDSRRLAVAYVDGNVRIYSASGELVATLATGGREAFTLAWSPDSGVLATGGLDAPIKIWDMRKLQELQQIEPGSHRVFCLAFRPDGRMLIAAGNETTRVWRVGPRKRIRRNRR